MKALSFNDVILVPNYNGIKSRKDVDTSVRFGSLSLGIPILSAAMDTITGPTMARKMFELGGLGFLHRFCSIEDNIDNYRKVYAVAYEGNAPTNDAVVSLGINEGLDRFHALYEIGARFFSIDTAHAHNKHVGNFIKQIKEFDDKITLVAGSVCTYAGSDYLASCGADIIRVGIGGSSVCQTRVKTGFGVPLFSALLECSKVDRPIIADGGVRNSGDAVKCFVAGATYVMCGSLLAGTEETPGELFQYKSKSLVPYFEPYKILRGMASIEAQQDFYGQQSDWKTAEGVTVEVPYKGPVANVVGDLIGGIRSGLTYAGCSTLDKLRHRVTWREVTHSGYIEGTPYGKN